MKHRNKLSLVALSSLALALTCTSVSAITILDWNTATYSVSFNSPVNPQSNFSWYDIVGTPAGTTITATGATTGDVATTWSASFTYFADTGSNSFLRLEKSRTTGGVANALSMEIAGSNNSPVPATGHPTPVSRGNGRLEVTVSLGGGYNFKDAQITFLDVDTEDALPNVLNGWTDRVTVNEATVSLAAADPANQKFALGSNTITGLNGNAGNSTDDGNAIATIAGVEAELSFTFDEQATTNDGAEGGRIAFSVVSFEAVPEPSSALLGLVGLAGFISRRRR
jgi:MYXO-CTERM domain-containing protein